MKKWMFLVVFTFAFILASSTKADLPKSADESGVDHGVKWTAHVLVKGDSPNSLFGNWSNYVIRFNKMAKKYWKPGVIIKKPVADALPLLKEWTPMPKEYENCSQKGVCLSKSKIGIVVDLKEQFLGVYEYGKLKKFTGKKLEDNGYVYISYPVATGMSAVECLDSKTKQLKSCATPSGFFKIQTSVKDKSRKVKISKIFSYRYKVWMYWPLHLGNSRFIHGTSPANNLPGYAASHGCVRMFNKNAYALYKMIPIGTPVFIVPTTD